MLLHMLLMHSSIKEVSFSWLAFSKEAAMLLLACKGKCCLLLFYNGEILGMLSTPSLLPGPL